MESNGDKKTFKEKIGFRNLTLIFSIFGGFLIFLSTIRWFFIYYDLSQFFMGSLVGMVFIGFAFIYERLKDNEVTYKDFKLDIASIDTKINKLEVKFIEFKNGD